MGEDGAAEEEVEERMGRLSYAVATTSPTK